MENRDGSEVGAADAGLPRSRVCVAAVWRDTQTKVLKGYRPEQLRHVGPKFTGHGRFCQRPKALACLWFAGGLSQLRLSCGGT